MKSLLRQALDKLSRHDRDYFCGYLIPVEIISLVNDGADYEGCHQEWVVKRAKTNVEEGICNSTWFYCRLTKKQRMMKTEKT